MRSYAESKLLYLGNPDGIQRQGLSSHKLSVFALSCTHQVSQMYWSHFLKVYLLFRHHLCRFLYQDQGFQDLQAFYIFLDVSRQSNQFSKAYTR